MTITLYYLPASPPSRAVVLVLKYLELEFETKIVNILEKEHLEPEFAAINPQRCIPTIDDDGFILWESRAICQYLVNQYAPDNPIYPSDPKARAIVDRFLYFDIGTLYQAIGEYIFPLFRGGELGGEETEEKMKEKLQLLNDFLVDKTYIAGGDSITLADFSLLSSVTLLKMIDYDLSEYENIVAWIERLREDLPFYDEVVTDPIQEVKEFFKSKNESQD